MQTRRIKLNTGLTYFARELGTAQPGKLTVLLIHGFLDSSATWLPVVRHGLNDAGFHLLIPDMRGHGDSDRIGAGGYYHFADYLADIDALVATLAQETQIALVGHSMGGSICAYLAGAFPNRFHKLVLLEGMGPPEMSTPAPLRIVNWLTSWRRLRTNEPRRYKNISQAAARLRAHDSLLSEELSIELATLSTHKNPDGGYQFKHDPVHASQGPYPFRVDVAQEFWRAITCPVLAIEGALSPLRQMLEETEHRYAHIKNLRREVIADASHMMTRHQPKKIAELLIEFLSTNSATAPGTNPVTDPEQPSG